MKWWWWWSWWRCWWAMLSFHHVDFSLTKYGKIRKFFFGHATPCFCSTNAIISVWYFYGVVTTQHVKNTYKLKIETEQRWAHLQTTFSFLLKVWISSSSTTHLPNLTKRKCIGIGADKKKYETWRITEREKTKLPVLFQFTNQFLLLLLFCFE